MTARLRLGAGLVIATALLAGCASGPPAANHASEFGVITAQSPTAGATAGASPVRWWFNGTDPIGSPIGSTSPALHPSRATYCGMLRAAVSGGHGVFGPTANDGTAAEFVTELAAVAPAPVTTAWHTVAARLAAAVTSGATPAAAAPSAVRTAAARIATDARTACGVTLSRGG